MKLQIENCPSHYIGLKFGPIGSLYNGLKFGPIGSQFRYVLLYTITFQTPRSKMF